MPQSLSLNEPAAPHPIDLIEELAAASDLEAQRVDDTEVHLCLTGTWRDISLWCTWREEAHVLQIGAPLELKVPGARTSEVLRLLALINERLWLGHFDLWGEESSLVYRHGAVLSEDQGMAPGQVETLLAGVMEAFDHYYPAFNYCIWGGRPADEALASCILDPVGSA